MARTWMTGNCGWLQFSFVPLRNYFNSSRKQILKGYFRKIFLFYHEKVCCVYLLELPHQFQWVHSTYHYFIADVKDITTLLPFASWPCAMINHRWLELMMSQTNFHGPKDVWAIEVRLYFVVKQDQYLSGHPPTPPSLI